MSGFVVALRAARPASTPLLRARPLGFPRLVSALEIVSGSHALLPPPGRVFLEREYLSPLFCAIPVVVLSRWRELGPTSVGLPVGVVLARVRRPGQALPSVVSPL